MIMKKKNKFGIAGMLMAGFMMFTTSCENQDISYSDYDYQTVYFANQTFVRTITLGDDVYSTELDNQHKFEIYATLGGVESNKKDRKVAIEVDNSLLDGLKYENLVDGTATTALPRAGEQLEAMPSNYYNLKSNTITIPEGQIMGAVEVELTDAFFADPKAATVNYIIPVKIVSAQDSILEDKDYIFYAVTYKNKYHGVWLNHGTDEIDLNGTTSTVTREAANVESYDLCYLTTVGLQQSNYQITTTVEVDTTIVSGDPTTVRKELKTLTCDLNLQFDSNEGVTVSTSTAGCTASGSGSWKYKGALQAWGDTDRDLLSLSYTVKYNYTDDGRPRYKTIKTTEELIMRDRQSKFQTFTYTK